LYYITKFLGLRQNFNAEMKKKLDIPSRCGIMQHPDNKQELVKKEV